uniref:SOUL heme-binding protein n=1 Tax=Trieres chinensis TaxID=1514140 RepID=A0A6U1WDA0_TRICV|mmetsp:Transcript_29438/g.60169  ORF Transcript_29438/g.60169 Transcript_29438/m.60169 type:complete len:221 (+) Transcript_29438:250-912(+)
MGIVFGRTGVSEPHYDLLLSRSFYEIRRYGRRFAVEAEYGGEDDLNSAFRLLAGYIGVGRPPRNDGGRSIAMTAPVVTTDASSGGGKKIAMTAPVVTDASGGRKGTGKVMQFILPAEFDERSKIPNPTDAGVRIAEVPPAVGAVHRFDGWVKEKKAREKVSLLVGRLNSDGLDIKETDAFEKYLLWQYNPPFTIPQFRRNEVWIELTEGQVDQLRERSSS